MAASASIQSFKNSYFQESVEYLADSIYKLFRRFFIRIILAGPIPQNIVIIMDGNHRHATNRKTMKLKGHESGYTSLMHTLRDCYDLGIKYVTIYAFSIDNYRHPKEEVETLMNLMHDKLEALIEKESRVNQYKIRVQILGDPSAFFRSSPTTIDQDFWIDEAQKISFVEDLFFFAVCYSNSVAQVLLQKPHQGCSGISEILPISEA
ncbi:hypothetical protein KI387_043800 [Taxus chinensis]|uniref:Alkyl transferase n=1 Tax=Taxus chinensis TaxID=29808 RepID=A0AA38KIS9_TAXCH|nr:hypothetical protein KI387_043800 [Taxus chinensis]